eukprot:SRR837773.2026.p1 GENE.SRR837773.2026~~SRR837773.2026.p1  ORF type:complete len:280 (+),score=79.70 SRR837773.2026:124-840(+)
MIASAAAKGKIPSALKPDRIAMLDPFWSPSNEVRVLTRMYELAATYNITVEVTRASPFSAPARYGEALKAAKEYFASFSWVDPAYVDPIGIEWLSGPGAALKHMAAKTSYFLGIDPRNPNAATGPSAATPNEVLKAVQASKKYWRQTAGTSTETIMDDKYELLEWATSPPLRGSGPEQVLVGFLLLNAWAWSLTLICCCCGCFHGHKKAQAWRRARDALAAPEAPSQAEEMGVALQGA